MRNKNARCQNIVQNGIYLAVFICLILSAHTQQAHSQQAQSAEYFEIHPLEIQAYNSFGYDINNKGDHVGRMNVIPTKHAYLFSSDGTSLHGDRTLIDLHPPGHTSSIARAISENGLVVGFSVSSEYADTRAALFTEGSAIILGPLGADSEASGVNSAGVIVGFHFINGGAQATYWKVDPDNPASTPPMDLPKFTNAESIPRAITESGMVIGWASLENTHVCAPPTIRKTATVWTPKQLGTGYNITALPLLSGYCQCRGWAGYGENIAVGNCGLAINNPILWERKNASLGASADPEWQIHELDGLDPEDIQGTAYGVNKNNCIVGNSRINDQSFAVLWKDGDVYDLNSLVINGEGWTLTRANDINDSGEIVGYGKIDGKPGFHAFILKPIKGGTGACSSSP